ncbi:MULTISPECIES: DUF2806 domain-containing protein [unclassified Mesorhizobium]|uniref:DUF2806 domain-containing protein n=1 Tax=unclassified Mesorhizobium TaxID=325217 RepID=UPI00333B3381
MTANEKPQAPDALEVALDIDPSSGKFGTKVRVPGGFGKAIARAAELGFAGFSTKAFERAKAATLKARIDEAMTDRICQSIANADDREVFAAVLHHRMQNDAAALEDRYKILELTAEHLAAETPFRDAGATVSDAFLKHFWSAADRLTNDEARIIFSRILSGEIVHPGRFSASTLNLLTMLHPTNASKFELLCRMTMSNGDMSFVIVTATHAGHPNTKSNSISSSNRIGEFLIDFGLTREDLLDLKSIGLIRSIGEEEYLVIRKTCDTGPFDFAGRSIRLAPGHSAQAEHSSFGVISLTATGNELRSVIALHPVALYEAKLGAVLEIADVGLIS